MTSRQRRKVSIKGITLFGMIGVLLIAVPIFVFVILDNIQTHDQRVIENLRGRGAALIRSFEAGARTGVMVMMWGGEKVQRLLMETALQEDIAYILITDDKGRILAHSEPEKVGAVYSPLPDFSEKEPAVVLYRRVENGGDSVFEVFKRFTPDRPPPVRGRLQSMIDRLPPGEHKQMLNDWCAMHFFRDMERPPVRQYIFVGFDMERIDAARSAYIRHAVTNGVVMLLIVCTGMLALFFIQAYRAARSSFVRVKALSDEVVANMPAGLVTFGPDRRITSCNRRASEILGVAAVDNDDAPGDMGALPPAVAKVAEQVTQAGGNVSGEVEVTGPDGVSRVLDIGASPIRDDAGRVSGYLLLLKDLTGIRRLEKEVARSRRLAAIGKLAAGVAHEIRNPLSSIKGFATYFKEKFSDSERDRKTADTMIYEVERLNRAVTQLLEFARPISLEMTDVPPGELIEHSLRLMENDFANKGIESSAHIHTTRPTIRTDRDRMNQVLLNLYLNAVDAMESGGRLSVTVLDASDGDAIVIDVSDTGHGIAEKDMDQIFDPYFTTRSRGTGLGLAIVYKLVETLGGAITVESRIGHGTTFHIRVPDGAKEAS
ncbi:MAG: ATP-binding protein [Thermodesulfobacteriota bacterium]